MALAVRRKPRLKRFGGTIVSNQELYLRLPQEQGRRYISAVRIESRRAIAAIAGLASKTALVPMTTASSPPPQIPLPATAKACKMYRAFILFS
jgi:hypothetical protein